MASSVVRLPNLELQTEIGHGSEGTVYRATRDGKLYAVKIRDRQGFWHEATALACIRHPNLVSIIEVNQVDQRSYIVMEYAEGPTLKELIGRGPIEERTVVRMIQQIASALEEIHRFGLIHRDVKPENVILVGKDLDAKVVDFGFTGRVQPGTSHTTTIGTLLYSSPEQAGTIKRSVDGRSDLYSLGCVLFECLTGRPPFESRDAGELLHLHASAPAPNPRTLNPRVSPALALITLKLLSKDLDDRYQTCCGLIADLAQLDRMNLAIERKEEVGFGLKDNSFLAEDLPLVGRQSELSQLMASWRQARLGTGQIALVEGPPGSGKSRLVRELMQGAISARALTLTGKCAMGSNIPLAALREAIDAFLQRAQSLPPKEKAATLLKVRIAAGDLAPVLKRLSAAFGAVFGEVEELSELDSQEVFFEAIATFLVRLSGEFPALLFFIDDIQWLDEASRKVLGRLCNQTASAKLLVLGASRNDSESQVNLAEFVSDTKAGLWTRIVLAPLSPEGTRELIATHLGKLDLDPQLVGQIWNRSQGNPLAIGEYLKVMLDAGLLRPSWGKWEVDLSGLERLNLPSDVIQLIVRRISDLSAPTQEALKAAAVLGSRFRVSLLQHIVAEDVTGALTEALQAHMIEPSEAGEYAFVHDRVQEALLSGWEPAALRALHQKIAEALAALPESGKLDRKTVYALAHHYAAGDVSRNPEQACAANIAAGQMALRHFAYLEAESFFAHAQSIAAAHSVTADRVPLLEGLADIAARKNRLPEAIAHIKEALSLVSDPLKRAELRYRLSRVYGGYLAVEDSLEQTLLAFREIGNPLPQSLPGQILSILGYGLAGVFLHKTGLFFGSAKGWRRERYRLMVRLCEVGATAALSGNRVLLLMQFGFRSLFRAQFLGVSPELVGAFSAFGGFLANFQAVAGVERYRRRAIGMAEQIGDPTLIAKVRSDYCVYTFTSGDYRKSQQLVDETVSGYRQWMEAMDYKMAIGPNCWNLRIRGHTAKAISDLSLIIPKREDIHEGDQLGWLIALRMASYAVAGRVTEGLADLQLIQDYKMLETRDGIHRAAQATYLVDFYTEIDELGEPLERMIQYFNELKVNPAFSAFPFRFFFVYQVNARIAQCLKLPKDQRGPGSVRVKKVEDALRLLKKGNHPLFMPHFRVATAVLHWLKGKPAKALQELVKAEHFARMADYPICCFDAIRYRAWILREQNTPESIEASRMEARAAHALAIQYGWPARAARIRKEFGIEHLSSTLSESLSASRVSGRTGDQSFKLKRHLDALLQLSEASSTIMKPSDLSRVALDEIVKILGAERAFLFLADPASGKPLRSASRDAHAKDLPESQVYSTTIVDRVRASLKPLVFTGTDDGEISASKSIVAHNLRSIMAAPILKSGELVGIVYLDSSVARGIFNEDDVEILIALANHIAVALQTARAAQLEVEKKGLEKDLEARQTIQTILDNLDQGFMAFDSSGKIEDGVSKATFDLLRCDPRGKSVASVLCADLASERAVREWAEILFGGLMPFEDLKSAGPKTLSDPQGRHIELDYRPVMSAAGTLQKVIVISTDKTKEREFQARARAESEKVQMVLAILRSKSAFGGFVRETRKNVEAIRAELRRSPGDIRTNEMFRLLHTIKGTSASYYIGSLSELAHRAEDELSSLRGGLMAPDQLEHAIDRLRQRTEEIRAELEDFLVRWRDVFGTVSDTADRGGAAEDLSQHFDRFVPMVRELALQLGKEAELELTHTPVRVRAGAYDGLLGAMTHAVRNAIDHGIETPSDREKAGKARKGRIRMSVSEVAGADGSKRLRIGVRDDGRGIDVEKIRHLAAQKGLLSREQLGALSSEKVAQLLFEPGFSSKSEVSELSGRGVGLDAIRTEARRLGGDAWITGYPGQGTELSVEVPLSPALTLQPQNQEKTVNIL